MSNELIRKKLFTRRAIVLGACKAGLVAGLLSRMFYLQVLSNKEFVRLSENNRIKTIILPPLRGRIFDRNNKALALNEQNYQLTFEKLEFHNQKNIYEIALRISDILNYSPIERADLINQLNELSLGDEYIISQNLDWSQLEALELGLYELVGTNIEIGFDRFYPYAALCGHLTGYIGTISNKESQKPSLILYPNLKIGKNGIEKTQEQLLHGVKGFHRIEVNAKGEAIREISTSKSVMGKDINLTIDIDLQKKATSLLGDATGVILVAKISNGEILVSVSQPSFDPNLFNHGIALKDWNNLINNPELPLIDRSVALTYPPGSGFKVNVAIAALKQNFNPETHFFCPGHYVLGDRVFHCWNKAGHGSINLYQAIASSCNVYFWNVAKIIGIQAFADVARLMGYDKKLLENTLPREQKGIIPDPAWKKKNIGTNWTLADTINSAIGQGYVEATPMQILTMITRIASGKEVTPTIIKSEHNKINFPSLNLERELQIIKKGMEMTVNSDIGTAYSNRIITQELAMAGKTGTSQVISKRHADDDLSKANVTKRIRNHGIFVSYAPLTNPEYAFCGIIEHGGTPALAIKIAKELLTEAQLKKI